MTSPTATDRYHGFTQEWHCTAPAWGETYRVLRDEWTVDDKGKAVRRIYEWEPINDRPRITGISPITYARWPRWRRRLHRLRHPGLWLVILGLVLATGAGSCQSTGGGTNQPGQVPVPSPSCTSPSPNPNPQPQPGCS